MAFQEITPPPLEHMQTVGISILIYIWEIWTTFYLYLRSFRAETVKIIIQNKQSFTLLQLRIYWRFGYIAP